MNAHIDPNPGYFDPQAEALSLGEHLGRVRAKQQALLDGDAEYQRGLREGLVRGHENAIALGNEQMQRQMEFTRQHIEENAVLAQRLEAQRVLIEEMQARLGALECAHAELDSTNTSLQEALSAAREDNERLRAENSRMTERYEERSQALAEQVWQYNHAVVFLNTVRVVLEHVVNTDPEQASRVRELFARRYGEQVDRALAGGMIRMPPDKDDTFARLMPRTQRFITKMLTTGQHQGTQPHHGIGTSNAQESADPAPDESRYES